MLRISTFALVLAFLSILSPGFFIAIRRNSLQDLINSPVNLSNLVSAGFLAVAFAVSVIWIMKNARHALAALKTPLGWYGVYAGVALLTTTYSGYPFLTMARALILLAGVVVLVSLVGQTLEEEAGRGPPHLLRDSAIGLWVFLILVWVASILTPSEALASGLPESRLTGGRLFYWSANIVGDVGGLCALSAVAGIFPPRGRTAAGVVAGTCLGVLTVLSTLTRSAIVALFLGLVVVIWFRKKRWSVLAAAAALVPVGIWIQDRLVAFVLRGQSVDQFLLGTGRVPYWSFALEDLRSNWLLGHGFYVGGRLTIAQDWLALTGNERSNLDNTFLEVLANGGVIGFLPFALFVGWLLWMAVRAARKARGERSPEADAVLFGVAATVFLFVRSVFGPTFHDWGFPLLVVVLSGAVFARSLRSDDWDDWEDGGAQWA